MGHTADAEDSPVHGQLRDEPAPDRDLRARRHSVRGDRSRVRRDDVPQKHRVLEIELLQRSLDYRRRRLCGSHACELALGREGNSGDPRPSIPGGLADEQDGRRGPCLEIRPKPGTQQPGTPPFAVLVEGLADPGRRELLDECVVSYDDASVRGARATGLRGRLDVPPTRRT